MVDLFEKTPGIPVNTPETPGNSFFTGYGNPNFVMLPRIFIRQQMQDLTEAELKVMLYIFDHTWGYTDEEGNRKDADAISRSQFLNGIRRADGTQLDRGAGVCDRSLDRALDSLVGRGYIFRHRRVAPNGRSDTNIYELNRYGKPSLADTPASQENAKANEAAAPLPLDNENGPEVSTTHSAALYNHPRKFAPLPALRTGKEESTPANLRPTTPAILRPSTPVKLRDTIENQNKQKIKQHTTQTDHQVAPGRSENTIHPDTVVCVSSSFEGISEKFGNTPPASPDAKGVSSHPSKTSPASDSTSTAGPRPGTEETSRGVRKADPTKKDQGPHQEQAELTQDLLKAGISQKEALALAAEARQNGHTGDYVKQALAYIDRQRSVHNREGLLIHLLKTDWRPPASEPQALAGNAGSTPSEVPLPPASSIRPEHLPRLIEIETRNLQEATSDYERETARSRLAHFQALAARLKPDEALADNEKKG